MSNWCNTALVFEGDKQEIKTLYQTMKKLERRKTPLVENGFGTNWLGCLVEALGGKWENTYCRGSWMSLQCQGNVLRMETETAWAPCIETYDFICEKFPSLTYYYISEEPMMDFYETNDSEVRYFKDRYAVDAHFPDDGYVTEYFPCLEKTLDWVSRMCGCAICSEKDLCDLNRQWKSAGTDNYCYLYQYNVV